MNHFDVDRNLSEMIVLVDTREQDTSRARKRLQDIGCQIERVALKFGDYSARCPALDLTDQVAIERKMDLDEIAACYGSSRRRFTNEFERAKTAGAKTYLLVENGSWESVYTGCYRSKMSPKALAASLQAWLARYECQIIFCKQETSGRLIHDILYREMKERLVKMEDESNS